MDEPYRMGFTAEDSVGEQARRSCAGFGDRAGYILLGRW